MKSASPAPRPGRALWTCPRCCARFATRNAWHSCGRATLAEWRSRMGPRTRIRCLGLIRCVGVSRLLEQGVSADLARPRPRPLLVARPARIKEVASGWRVREPRVLATRRRSRA